MPPCSEAMPATVTVAPIFAAYSLAMLALPSRRGWWGSAIRMYRVLSAVTMPTGAPASTHLAPHSLWASPRLPSWV